MLIILVINTLISFIAYTYLMLLEEPFEFLDILSTKKLIDRLNDLRKDKVIIIINHKTKIEYDGVIKV